MESTSVFSTKILQKIINHYLKLDTRSQEHLKLLSTKYFLLQITDLNLSFHIVFNKNNITVEDTPPVQSPDLTLSGSAIALWRLFQSDEKTFQRHLREVKMSGDLNFAQDIQTFFHTIDIDWEEQLSDWVGDVFAHELCRGWSAFHQWGSVVSENFRLNLREYLQEEANHFPVLDEVKEFENEVDKIRDDVERLEARIQRLSKYEYS